MARGGNNNQNLIIPTSEQARENGRKGGIASQKKQKERKEMKEFLNVFLSMPLKKGEIKDMNTLESIMQAKNVNLTGGQKIMLQLILLAIKGDLKAIKTILELLGELEQNVKVTTVNSEMLGVIEEFLENGQNENT